MADNLTGTADGDSGIVTFDSPEEITISANREELPGKRIKNPLSQLASYTYQLSLYMITPTGYNEFIASGRKNISSLSNNSVYLIAQSGGINNSQEKRANGFNYDYYLDNATIESVINPKETGTASNTVSVKFTITEPYGFSFISNLRRATDSINYSSPNDQLPINITKQFFILGVRFFGYNDLGELITSTSEVDGEPIDPNNTSTINSLFDRYYDIAITAINFKIEGKATVYNIEAVSVAPQQAFSITRGVLDKTFTVPKATTVSEALTLMMEDCSNHQKETYSSSGHDPLTQYEVRFIGENSELISEASLITADDTDKTKQSGSDINDTEESTAAVEVKSEPNRNHKFISIKTGTPILQAINNIITLSDFAKKPLKELYTDDLEPNEDTNEVNKTRTNPNTNVIRWFNCSAEIRNPKWIPEVNDWSFTIVYLIQVYETPYIDSPLATNGMKYYGPYKKYDYWYTGKNTEVLSYNQTLDNTYYNVVLAETGALTNTPLHASKLTNESRLGTIGATAEAVNNYVTSLYDPYAQATATIQILGDPDLLFTDSSYSELSFNKFYGTDGFSINPNSGQVFIEIDFKEAIDYINPGLDQPSATGSPGTMSINDSIMFWRPLDFRNTTNSGLTYMITTISSTFYSGQFKQTISGVMPNNLDNSSILDNQQRVPNSSTITDNNSGPAMGNDTVGLGKNNLLPELPFSVSSSIATTIENTTNLDITINTNRGPVADDDGSQQVNTINQVNNSRS